MGLKQLFDEYEEFVIGEELRRIQQAREANESM